MRGKQKCFTVVVGGKYAVKGLTSEKPTWCADNWALSEPRRCSSPTIFRTQGYSGCMSIAQGQKPPLARV